MALTRFRWLAAAIMGCLALSVVVLRSQADNRPDRGVERRNLSLRASRHYGHANVAAGRLRLLQLRDSIQQVAARARVATPVRIFRDAALSAEAQPALDWLIHRATGHLRDDGEIPIDIAFVYDTLRSLNGAEVGRAWTRIEYLLPRHSGDRCTVIYRIGGTPPLRRILVSEVRSESAAEHLLGPCAYYREFGMPGARVARWLEERGLSFARYGSWQRPAPVYTADRYSRWYTAPLLLVMPPAGANCVAGNADDCEPLIVGSGPQVRSLVWGNIASSTSLGAQTQYYRRNSYGLLGPQEQALLADMVRTLGPERFAAFWKSTESVPAAFEKAAGEPIGKWTASWAARSYETGPIGPEIPGWTAVVSVLLIALGILVAVRVSADRQFA